MCATSWPSTEADAKAIIAKLKGGAKFEDLAKTSKDTGSAANNGGDLDWALAEPIRSRKPVFSTAFVALQKGQVTETPVQTQNGFHVIKLDDTRPGQTANPGRSEAAELLKRCSRRSCKLTRKNWSRKQKCSNVMQGGALRGAVFGLALVPCTAECDFLFFYRI
jgi:hypothetical protein